MKQETLKMSEKERGRLVVMHRLRAGELSLKEAAWEMRVSLRQAVRIKQRFLRQRDAGLVHRSRGRPSNRRTPVELREQALAIYRERYAGFGPTFACEMLAEHEQLAVNRETLRRWLIAAGLWRVGEKQRVHRKRRRRRERFGELLQLDGSDHDWFEGRADPCTLMVLVDDATNQIGLRMAPSETTAAALSVLRDWVSTRGVPVALYADCKNVYFSAEYVHNPRRRGDPGIFTQFMKVANRLGIEMIPAYSPQAKGRVERINGVLQDRLVKTLRLRRINTIEAANAMLGEFAAELNRRFARAPLNPADAHRSAPHGREQWEYFFCFEETRTLQKDHTVVYQNTLWQILPQRGGPQPGARITLRRPLGGRESYWLYGNQRLEARNLGPARQRRGHAAISKRPDGI
jgi:hypothetical protein